MPGSLRHRIWSAYYNKRDFIITLNRPALLEARQRAQGVSQGGLGAVDSAIRKRFL